MTLALASSIISLGARWRKKRCIQTQFIDVNIKVKMMNRPERHAYQTLEKEMGERPWLARQDPEFAISAPTIAADLEGYSKTLIYTNLLSIMNNSAATTP